MDCLIIGILSVFFFLTLLSALSYINKIEFNKLKPHHININLVFTESVRLTWKQVEVFCQSVSLFGRHLHIFRGVVFKALHDLFEQIFNMILMTMSKDLITNVMNKIRTIFSDSI